MPEHGAVPTAAELFNPADFAERLEEARARRERVLAAAGDDAPPPRRPVFLAGFASGLAFAALAAIAVRLAVDPASGGVAPAVMPVVFQVAVPAPAGAAPSLPRPLDLWVAAVAPRHGPAPGPDASPAPPASVATLLLPPSRPAGFSVPRRKATRIARETPPEVEVVRGLPGLITSVLRHLTARDGGTDGGRKPKPGRRVGQNR